jgi:hypothetical protein
LLAVRADTKPFVGGQRKRLCLVDMGEKMGKVTMLGWIEQDALFLLAIYIRI